MSFDLKVGFACDNDCIHCVITDKSSYGDLSTGKIKDIIARKIKDGESITLTGGEPTIRKDFFDILRFIKETHKASNVVLQTNGRKFQDKDFVKETLKYVDIFLVAIHSHDNLIHDEITKQLGSHRQTVEGLVNLVSLKEKHHDLVSQTVISKLNIKDLVKTYDLVHEIGIRKMNLTFPHPMGNAWDNFDKVVPQYKDIKGDIHKCILKYGQYISTEAIPLCYIHPYTDKVFYSDGLRKTKMPARGYDDSLKEKIVENYNTMLMEEFRKVPECKTCIFNDACVGVWKEYYEKYKNNMDLIPIRSLDES